MELAALDKIADDIAKAGGTLVSVSPQLPQFNREVMEKHRLRYPVLSDPGNRAAREFRIVHTLPGELRDVYRGFGIDLPAANGDETWTLPMPARYVIDPRGVIRAADINPDYTVRPEPSATLTLLRDLAGR